MRIRNHAALLHFGRAIGYLFQAPVPKISCLAGDNPLSRIALSHATLEGNLHTSVVTPRVELLAENTGQFFPAS